MKRIIILAALLVAIAVPAVAQQKAIIHTATRVIMRVTTDDAPTVPADYSVVSLTEPIDLAGGPWKLDDTNQKVVATSAEAQQAGIDETYNAQQLRQIAINLRDAIDGAITADQNVENFTGTTSQFQTVVKQKAAADRQLAQALRQFLKAAFQ